MIKKILHQLAKQAYLVVAIGVLLGFVILKNTTNKLTFEMVLVVLLFYFLSAFVHHLHDKSLTFEVMVEYLLLAGLMLVILVSFFI